jgi:protein-S-isoprenylcysteine O-methyltransferase Ste14
MKLKIPPIVIFFIVALIMYGLAASLPVGYFDFFGRIYLMGVLLLLALILGLTGLVQFYMDKTSLDPIKPEKTTQLVTKGVFSFTRNPMYLALLLVLLAWGLWLGNAFNTILAAGFVMYMNKFHILPEEMALAKLFGKEYAQYCVRVRRWF